MKKPKPENIAHAKLTARGKGNPVPNGRPLKAKKGTAGRRRASAYSSTEIHEIFRRFSIQRPAPESELDFIDPFTLLVAVVLSAQATDAGVNKATQRLFADADTPAGMAALGEARIGAHIRTVGLWRNKARNVLALSQALLDEHGGNVPGERSALMALPGVGRKTANVVLNVAFGQPTMAVDTHIFRLANRLRLAPGDTPDAVEQALVSVIPAEYMRHAHHWLILHGRYVCKARRPECERCIIADLCKYPAKTAEIPAPLVPIMTASGNGASSPR